MSVLERIAYTQGRRDELPNQELARHLAECQDREGIAEIARNLWNPERGVQSDCLKVLYEIGYIQPDLIAGYWGDFLKLLRSKNNRLVWGAMIALSTLAALQADELYPHVDAIRRAVEAGSVITRDNGVRALAGIAAANPAYRAEIVPYLLDHLRTCRPKDVPQRAESVCVAIDADSRAAFVDVLEWRMDGLSASGAARVRKILRNLEV